MKNICVFRGLFWLCIVLSPWSARSQSGVGAADDRPLSVGDTLWVRSQRAPSGANAMGDTGLVVCDLQLREGVCWFAGRMYCPSGEATIARDGRRHAVAESRACVGWFGRNDVVAGRGGYHILLIPELSSVDRLAVSGRDAVCLGTRADGTRRLVEVHPEASGRCRYQTLRSSYAQEEFQDVAMTAGRVVVLSRFNHPERAMLHRHCFGLRYGSAVDFQGTGSTLNCYTTYAVAAESGSFVGVGDVRLTATQVGEGVTVSYRPPTGQKTVSIRVSSCGDEVAEFGAIKARSLVDVYRYALIPEAGATAAVATHPFNATTIGSSTYCDGQ